MPNTIDATTPHDAVVKVLTMFDVNTDRIGPVLMRIALPANVAIDMAASPFSPLSDFVAALTFIGQNRGTIWDAVNVMKHGETFPTPFSMVINGDRLEFVRAAPVGPLHMSCEVERQVLHSNANGYAYRPLTEKLVTYGILHAFAAEMVGTHSGSALYDIDGMTTAPLPLVMVTDDESTYSPPSPYPPELRSPKLLDGKNTGLQWLEDVQMLMAEGVSLGLRHAWVRRIAVPVVMAHVHMRKGIKPEIGIIAVKIVRQCSDPILRRACVSWIAKRYNLGEGQLNAADFS